MTRIVLYLIVFIAVALVTGGAFNGLLRLLHHQPHTSGADNDARREDQCRQCGAGVLDHGTVCGQAALGNRRLQQVGDGGGPFGPEAGVVFLVVFLAVGTLTGVLLLRAAVKRG